MAAKRITPIKTIVETINCIFKVDSILSKVYTDMQWVASIETKMQTTIPRATIIKGNMKFEM